MSKLAYIHLVVDCTLTRWRWNDICMEVGGHSLLNAKKSHFLSRIKLTKCKWTKQLLFWTGDAFRRGILAWSKVFPLKLRDSAMFLVPLTWRQTSLLSTNTSMKNSWGHGKFDLKKRRPWTVLRPVTIVAICSLLPPLKRIIESEITFLSCFKREGCVFLWVLTTIDRTLVYILYRVIPLPPVSLPTSALSPPDQYGPSSHLPHLIKTPSMPLWEASKGTMPERGHADETSMVCFAGPLHNRGCWKSLHWFGENRSVLAAVGNVLQARPVVQRAARHI